MQNHEILQHSDYVKAWLVYTLGTTIIGGILGALIGGILGAVLGVAGPSLPHIKVAAPVVGLSYSIPLFVLQCSGLL